MLRGPQGTLYGRNATAGVVNVVSAKPTDQFEAMLSADWGNYSNRRYEGMVNLPIVDDRLDLRIAGHKTSTQYCHGYVLSIYRCDAATVVPHDVSRSRSVTVPNLGGYAGLSVRYNDAKISFGYRADEFFGAMDGGQATAKRENRGFYGPYLNLSLGFGG